MGIYTIRITQLPPFRGVLASMPAIESESMANRAESIADGVLASHAANGDEDAFSEIVRRYSPRVFRVCGRFFKRYSHVEEAAQETFLRAFTQIGRFEARGSLEGWLTRVASTTCINILRTQKRQRELSISDLTEDETTWIENVVSGKFNQSESSSEDRLIASDLIDKVIGLLKPDDALVLLMMESEGASIKEAAVRTGWTESKVKVRAFRARKKLREALEELLNKIG